jgi:thioredoxin-related protein
MQAPALQRVIEARNNVVSVIDIDTSSSFELAQRYQVLTVPTTVVLDATGQAHAVNYGFANTKRLLEQVDTVLAKVAS